MWEIYKTAAAWVLIVEIALFWIAKLIYKTDEKQVKK